MIVLLSVLSMLLGAVAAIGQRDIKRLMAFSSIAHMGYALIGLAAGTEMGVKAMLMYLAIYVTMNIGTFAFILMMERDGKPVTDIDALRQYSKRDPGKALAVLILMFSLAGVPPMLGFFAKFGVWQAGVDAGLIGWSSRRPSRRSSARSIICGSCSTCISVPRTRIRSKPVPRPVLWGR